MVNLLQNAHLLHKNRTLEARFIFVLNPLLDFIFMFVCFKGDLIMVCLFSFDLTIFSRYLLVGEREGERKEKLRKGGQDQILEGTEQKYSGSGN